MTDIVCLGEPLVEFTLLQDQARPTYLQGFGGDTSNAAVAAARFGAAAACVSALGADHFAGLLRRLWDAEGIDHRGVVEKAGRPTGIYFVIPDPAGRNFQYCRKDSAASLLHKQELPANTIRQAKALHLSAISQAISDTACETAQAAMDMARQAGVLVSYDTNLRLNLWPLDKAKPVIDAAAANCDIALPSLDDSKLLTGLDEPARIVDYYHGLGAGIVALKLGARGALVSDGRRCEQIKPHAVAAVDATGAGDAFDGVLLAAYLQTNCIFSAARHAAVAAALTTTGMGAVAPIPHAADVQAHVRDSP